MLISTRGRYALRVLADLAESAASSYIPLKDVAARQEISLKYLEGIMTALSKAGLVQCAHGRGGGYRLARAAEEIGVGEVLRLTEGSISPVACLEPGASACPRQASCRTLPMWQKLDATIRAFFADYTIADLMHPVEGGDYVI